MSTENTREQEIESIRQRMLGQGYQEIDATISIVKANVGAVILGLPFIVVCVFVYFSIHANQDVEFGLIEIFALLFVFFITIVVHELLHGLGWSFFCKNGFKSIRFGVIWKYLTPYCHCKEPLTFWPYLFGAILPFLVLGIGLFVISFALNSLFLFAIAMLNIFGAGGDLTILIILLKYRDACIVDHPTDPGFIAFKEQS